MQQDNCSLAIVSSSVLSPRKMNEKTRQAKIQTLPGAWIDEEASEDEEDNGNNIQHIIATTSDGDIELLKQTIANLRKEKEKLEETNDIVQKSIQIVARKRIMAQTNRHSKKAQKQQTATDEEEDIYVFVPTDFIPTQEEMKAAGLDGWEWITAY